MDDDAFRALNAIGERAQADQPLEERWIKAFKAIRWVVETQEGFVLTDAGRKARDEAAAGRRQARP